MDRRFRYNRISQLNHRYASIEQRAGDLWCGQNEDCRFDAIWRLCRFSIGLSLFGCSIILLNIMFTTPVIHSQYTRSNSAIDD